MADIANARTIGVSVSSPVDYGVNAITDTVPTGTFYWYKGSASSDPVDRSPIIEENMDSVAPNEIDGGMYGAGGTIDGTFRVDPASLAFLHMAMGQQGASPYTPTFVTQAFKLTQTPLLTCALMIWDEQANDNAGAGTYYTGVGISSMDLSLDVNGYAKTKFTWLGRRAITVSAVTGVVVVQPADWTKFPMAVYYNAVIAMDGTTVKAKGFTLKMDRKIDTKYGLIGSPFLQGLFYNGMTNLGGTLTVGAGEWDVLNYVMTGKASAGALDDGHTEFLDGTIDNKMYKASTTGLTIRLRKPNATADIATISALKAVFVKSNRSVQNRNQWEKSVEWQAELPTPDDFTIAVVVPT